MHYVQIHNTTCFRLWLPVQTGSSPVQLLLAWQVRMLFPWSVYPGSHVYLATESSVVFCMTIPFSMLSTGQLATACEVNTERMQTIWYNYAPFVSKTFVSCKNVTSDSERIYKCPLHEGCMTWSYTMHGVFLLKVQLGLLPYCGNNYMSNKILFKFNLYQ